MHYISLLVSLPSTRAWGFDNFLLGFSPLKYEADYEAKEHLGYINFVLLVLGKKVSNIVAISGDNAAVNIWFSSVIHKKKNPACFAVFC